MKAVAKTHLMWTGKLLEWTIDSLRETLNADSTTGKRVNGFTREEWKDVGEVLDRLEGACTCLCSILLGDKPIVAACGTANVPHPDDGEIYSGDADLHIHVGRECLAIVKNHNPDKSESDKERKNRLNHLRFMVTGRVPVRGASKKRKK